MSDPSHQFNVKTNIDSEKPSAENYDSDSDEYSYSEESLCSNDFSKNSDITNVTARSSLNSTTTTTSSCFNSQISSAIDKSKSSQRQLKKIPNNNQNRSCSSLNSISSGQRAYRRNMSFTNIEMMQIERENQYLLKKIMAQQRPTKTNQITCTPTRLSSSAINRKRLQKRIEDENMMMLRRIQGAKSCVFADRTVPGYRLTFL